LRFDVLSLLAAIDLELLEIGVTVEDFLVAGDAVIFDPLGRSAQPVGQPPDMSLPITDQKIEVMGSVAL
jgi:hypothetical protein